MVDKLFVYGTLQPGRPNEHILKEIGGSWEEATVKGTLHQKGWGAAMGFPGIVLNEQGEKIKGFLFTSPNLDKHWDRLDVFEGAAYQRFITKVELSNGTKTEAFIYALANPY